MFKKKKKIAKLWHNGEILARLFFEILATENLNLLKIDEGHAKKSDLKRAWAKIYDEYFELENDPKMNIILKTKMRILQMARSIEMVRQAVYAICTVNFDDEQISKIVDGIEKNGFEFDRKNPIDSCLSILKEQIPSLETRIEIERDNLDSLLKGEATTFEENCVAFESHGFRVDENCSLRRYVAYKKSVIKKSRKDGKRKTD